MFFETIYEICAENREQVKEACHASTQCVQTKAILEQPEVYDLFFFSFSHASCRDARTGDSHTYLLLFFPPRTTDEFYVANQQANIPSAAQHNKIVIPKSCRDIVEWC